MIVVLDASALLAYLQNEHRACLSLSLRLNAPVLTTDRVWANLDSRFHVQVIR